MTFADALNIAGGACELLGLGLVAFEIRSDRQKARALFGHVLVGALPMRGYARARADVTVESDSEPTLQERFDQLERDVGSLRVELDDRLHAERLRTDEAVDAAIARAQEEIDRVDRELRGHLAEVLTGSVRGRVLGAVLLALGVALSVAGNVAG